MIKVSEVIDFVEIMGSVITGFAIRYAVNRLVELLSLNVSDTTVVLFMFVITLSVILILHFAVYNRWREWMRRPGARNGAMPEEQQVVPLRRDLSESGVRTFQECQVVRLRRDLPDANLSAGAVGTIVMVYEAPGLTRGYEVEFVNDEGMTLAQVTLAEEDIEAA